MRVNIYDRHLRARILLTRSQVYLTNCTLLSVSGFQRRHDGVAVAAVQFLPQSLVWLPQLLSSYDIPTVTQWVRTISVRADVRTTFRRGFDRQRRSAGVIIRCMSVNSRVTTTRRQGGRGERQRFCACIQVENSCIRVRVRSSCLYSSVVKHSMNIASEPQSGGGQPPVCSILRARDEGKEAMHAAHVQYSLRAGRHLCNKVLLENAADAELAAIMATRCLSGFSLFAYQGSTLH